MRSDVRFNPNSDIRLRPQKVPSIARVAAGAFGFLVFRHSLCVLVGAKGCEPNFR
jgi:hypothetical protein